MTCRAADHSSEVDRAERSTPTVSQRFSLKYITLCPQIEENNLAQSSIRCSRSKPLFEQLHVNCE